MAYCILLWWSLCLPECIWRFVSIFFFPSFSLWLLINCCSLRALWRIACCAHEGHRMAGKIITKSNFFLLLKWFIIVIAQVCPCDDGGSLWGWFHFLCFLLILLFIVAHPKKNRFVNRLTFPTLLLLLTFYCSFLKLKKKLMPQKDFRLNFFFQYLTKIFVKHIQKKEKEKGNNKSHPKKKKKTKSAIFRPLSFQKKILKKTRVILKESILQSLQRMKESRNKLEQFKKKGDVVSKKKASSAVSARRGDYMPHPPPPGAQFIVPLPPPDPPRPAVPSNPFALECKQLFKPT